MTRDDGKRSPAADPAAFDPGSLVFDDRGLVPVIVQDASTGAVLMQAFADRQAVERTIATGEAHFWSRSREALWRKGETSGNVLRVTALATDCDRDSLLVLARPAGPTCHTGRRSCFDPNPLLGAAGGLELGWLQRVLEERRESSAEESYTARLLERGVERVAQKVGEEGVETALAAVAAAGEEGDRRLAAEAADLLYHLLVLLMARGVALDEVGEELLRRHAAGGGR